MLYYNAPPIFSFTSPAESCEPGQGTYTIRWSLSDAEDVAAVTLRYENIAAPYDSGMISPVQPSSAISCQSDCSKPCSLSASSRIRSDL